MKVVDLFSGGGGFSLGAQQAGLKVRLAIESDPKIANVYAKNFDHTPRVELLGGEVDTLASELSKLGSFHLHGSPPCVRLSQVNQTNRDPKEGLRLIRWYLALVDAVSPSTWSMEQVAHPALLTLLKSNGVHFCVVDAVDFGVPQHRKRCIAGSPHIITALEQREGTGPTVVPMDVLPQLPSSVKLTNGTSNQPIKVRKNGVSLTVGHRPMKPGEGSRDLKTPSHTVWGTPGSIFDQCRNERVRKITPRECAALQGFPDDFLFDAKSLTRSHRVIGNAIPPPLAKFIIQAAILRV